MGHFEHQGPSQYKRTILITQAFPWYMRLSHDLLIFIMEIPIPGNMVFILKWSQGLITENKFEITNSQRNFETMKCTCSQHMSGDGLAPLGVRTSACAMMTKLMPCTCVYGLSNLTHWPLGDMDAILKLQFSISFYWLVSSHHLWIMSWDECQGTSPMTSQYWFR